MNETHTPGPWGFDIESGDAWRVDAGEKNVAWGHSETAYNARLISAAPDLLEALKMISDADDDCRVDGLQTMPRTARAALDAAIAKATGVR